MYEKNPFNDWYLLSLITCDLLLQTNIVMDQKDLEHAIMVVVSSPWGDVYCGMLNGDIAAYDVNVCTVN